MSTSSKEALRTRMTNYFGLHGRFCASHPWEVIVSIVTLTVCALSMSVLSGGKVGTVCGFQKPCQPKPADDHEVRVEKLRNWVYTHTYTLSLSLTQSLCVMYVLKKCRSTVRFHKFVHVPSSMLFSVYFFRHRNQIQ